LFRPLVVQKFFKVPILLPHYYRIMPPKKAASKTLKKSTKGTRAKATPAKAAPAIPDLEDSIILHPDSEEEASLLAELQQLKASKNQQEEQLKQAAKAERCLRLRQEISDLRGQLDAIKQQRAAATAPVQPPPTRGHATGSPHRRVGGYGVGAGLPTLSSGDG
jgi:hypothetical protein